MKIQLELEVKENVIVPWETVATFTTEDWKPWEVMIGVKWHYTLSVWDKYYSLSPTVFTNTIIDELKKTK